MPLSTKAFLRADIVNSVVSEYSHRSVMKSVSSARRPCVDGITEPRPVRGTYVLIISLDHDRVVTVGKLGQMMFRAGTYSYCGSAMAGYQGRVGRHFSKNKKIRWHIDYLLQEAEPVGAFLVRGGDGMECSLSGLLSSLVGSEPIEGFGCSDCSCRSHLYRIEESAIQTMAEAIHRLSSREEHSSENH
jgi:Uri superfamily endonuclease